MGSLRKEERSPYNHCCGSELASYSLFDARGIYVCRVCDKCIDEVKSRYRPEIFTDSDYWTCEDIDDDD